jgi:hypothetical protein
MNFIEKFCFLKQKIMIILLRYVKKAGLKIALAEFVKHGLRVAGKKGIEQRA